MFYDDENVDGKQRKMENFTRPIATVARPAASSHRANIITEGVTDFIMKDMHPVSTADGEGFLNLMQIAEPRYSVPCRKTIMSFIDKKIFICSSLSPLPLEMVTFC